MTSLREICEAVYSLLETLPIDAKVYYGDQNKLNYPTMLCVEPDRKVREIAGTHYYKVEYYFNVIVYKAFVRPAELNRKDADLLAEQVEELLDLDPTLGGLLIHFMVEQQVIDDSLAFAETPIRATKLFCKGVIKEIMPNV